MNQQDLRDILTDNGLKVTPQRLAILEAVFRMKNHPTVDKIIVHVKKKHPNIAVGTVYKILETLVDKGIIQKVKTDKDIMRYDSIIEKHHHLYCVESDRIEDYYDQDLNAVLEEYFAQNRISGFKIEDIKLQIIGRFLKGNKQE